MAVNDILALKIHGRYQDQNIVNTLHFKVTAQQGDDEDLCLDLVNTWHSAHSLVWAAQHNDGYVLQGLRADGAFAAGVSLVPGFRTVEEIGGVAGTPVAAYTCATVTLYVDSSNPRHRGRIMFSGRSTTDFTDDGGIVQAVQDNLAGLVASIRVSLNGQQGTYQLVVFQRSQKIGHDIVAQRSQPTPAVLRSRRIRLYSIG